MKFTVNVEEINLADHINAHDDETLADLVVAELVARFAKSDDYRGLVERVRTIRDEEIRKAIIPAVEEALTAPIKRTNSWGEVVGGNATLREHIVDVAKEHLNTPADSHDRRQGTRLEKAVRAQVDAAFKAEITEAVAQAKAAVVEQLGTTVADMVSEAVRAAMRSR